jgi:hypothetical protein
MNEPATEEMESSKESIRQEASGSPLQPPQQNLWVTCGSGKAPSV